MAQSGLTKDKALEYGFTPEVITTLGVMSLPGVGPSTIRELGDPDNIQNFFIDEDLASFTAKLNAAGAKFSPEISRISDWATLRERVWRIGVPMAAELMHKGIRCITTKSALYPTKLHDLRGRKPKWLFLRGDTSLLGARSIAVVGTRNPSELGDFLTKTAVSACRTLGRPVVSGLARGIDTIAHEWSLTAGLPTISILGTGILVSYPAKNTELAEKIVAQGGLLISEYMPTQPPSGENFVWRNRLQACLAECVIASEWNRSSGTAHTVRFANELSRPSISLELQGAGSPQEAGRAARHFVLPTDYAHFVETLAQGSTDAGLEDAYPPGSTRDSLPGSNSEQRNAENSPQNAQASLF